MLTRLVGVTAWSRDGFVLLVLKMGNNGCQAPSFIFMIVKLSPLNMDRK